MQHSTKQIQYLQPLPPLLPQHRTVLSLLGFSLPALSSTSIFEFHINGWQVTLSPTPLFCNDRFTYLGKQFFGAQTLSINQNCLDRYFVDISMMTSSMWPIYQEQLQFISALAQDTPRSCKLMCHLRYKCKCKYSADRSESMKIETSLRMHKTI